MQDVLTKTSTSLDELLHPSCREASEHTAAAALTELRNNNNHQLNKSSASSKSIVTSILSKNHIDHLEANSVSVIPIDTHGGIGQALNPVQDRISVKKLGQINAAVTIDQMNRMGPAMPPEAATALEMHRLTQLQQHLETAAVLMDISKKVIISPPSSNPQSPGVGGGDAQSQNNVKMTIKRSRTNDEVDLSSKRQRSDKVSTTVYQLDNNVKPSMSAVTIKSEPVYGNEEMSHGNRYESDNDTNDSDPGRLQMDISSSQDAEDGEQNDRARYASTPVKLVYKHNRSFNNNTTPIIDSGRDTPESNKSDDHRTDPATTQLWQALARSTGNGAGNEATQLLRQMITCRTLGLPMPSALNISRCGNSINNAQLGDQPMALIKVKLRSQTKSQILHSVAHAFSVFSLFSFHLNRMKPNRQDVENNRVQAKHQWTMHSRTK